MWRFIKNKLVWKKQSISIKLLKELSVWMCPSYLCQSTWWCCQPEPQGTLWSCGGWMPEQCMPVPSSAPNEICTVKEAITNTRPEKCEACLVWEYAHFNVLFNSTQGQTFMIETQSGTCRFKKNKTKGNKTRVCSVFLSSSALNTRTVTVYSIFILILILVSNSIFYSNYFILSNISLLLSFWDSLLCCYQFRSVLLCYLGISKGTSWS